MKTLLLVVFAAFAIFTYCAYAQSCTEQAAVHCTDLTCGVALPSITPSNVACTLCSKSHYGAAFTDCDSVTKTKTLFYFWKPPATCIINANASVTALPAPVPGVACGLRCPSGQHFNANALNCVSCNAGTTSQNNEIIIEDWFDFPRGGSQRCEIAYAYQKCSTSWKPYGDYIASVENTVGIRNVFEYTGSIVTPGAISIEYMTVLEDVMEYEELPGFWINDKIVLRLNTSTTWSTFTYPLNTPGSYKFGFTNRKLFPLRNNEFRIRKLVLTGTSDIDVECITCPAGTYAKEGKVCKACPRNTFSTTPGSSTCTPCPAFHISGLRATSCVLRNEHACNVTDYYQVFEPCNGGITRISYAWIEPRLCDPAHPLSVKLPADQLIQCADLVCTNNQVLAADGSCQYCPRGNFVSNNITGAQCRTCPVGSGTFNVYSVPRFTHDALSNVIQTGCVNCRTAVGWRFAGSYMDSGGNYSLSPRQPAVYAQIPLTVQRSGAVATVIASLSCPPGAYLLVSLSKPLKTVRIDCTGCQADAFSLDVSTAKTINITLDFLAASSEVPLIIPHESTLRVEYYPYVASSAYELADNCNRAVISQIMLTGTNFGGSSVCTSCPIGTASISNCEICQAGTFADSTTGNCTICPANTYALAQSPVCYACGEGRVSTPGASVCGWRDGVATFNTRVDGISRSINFANLAESTHKFPISVPSTTEQVYLNLAQIDHPVCGYSIMCSRASPTDSFVKIGETAGLTGIATEALYGVQLDVLSVKSCFSGGFLNSTIQITCSIAATSPVIKIAKRSSHCGYDVSIQTVEVCPQCVDDDYFLFKDNCDTTTGKQYQKWVKKPGAAHVCLNDVKDLKNVTFVACDTNIEVAFPVWSVFLGIILAVLVIGLVVVVIAAIGYVSVRYQLLNSKYQQRIANQQQ